MVFSHALLSLLFIRCIYLNVIFIRCISYKNNFYIFWLFLAIPQPAPRPFFGGTSRQAFPHAAHRASHILIRLSVEEG